MESLESPLPWRKSVLRWVTSVGAGVGPVVRRHARPGDPCATIRRHPAPVVGAGHPAETHHDPRGGA